MDNGSKPKPIISILGTGGTIAGSGKTAGGIGSYTAATVGIDDIVRAIPQLDDLAEIRATQVLQIGSHQFTDDLLLHLARAVDQAVQLPEVAGVIVLHGTDTLEETAYFLHLTIKTKKPIVITGAMRPATALSADGPLNIYDAVKVATSAAAAGMGVLVAMDGEIHSARDVSKSHANRPGSFLSPFGPLGLSVSGYPRFYRKPLRIHTMQSDFDIDRISELPKVAIVYSHANMGSVASSALLADGVRGVVHVGFGSGGVPDYIATDLREARQRGVFIVRAARTASGAITRNGVFDDDLHDFIVADDQSAARARLLLSLGLTKYDKACDLQRLFYAY